MSMWRLCYEVLKWRIPHRNFHHNLPRRHWPHHHYLRLRPLEVLHRLQVQPKVRWHDKILGILPVTLVPYRDFGLHFQQLRLLILARLLRSPKLLLNLGNFVLSSARKPENCWKWPIEPGWKHFLYQINLKKLYWKLILKFDFCQILVYYTTFLVQNFDIYR